MRVKKNLREGWDPYFYDERDDIHSSRQVRDLFKQELFHPTKDYSKHMKQAMAYTVEHNLHEKEKAKLKKSMNESELDLSYEKPFAEVKVGDTVIDYNQEEWKVLDLAENYHDLCEQYPHYALDDEGEIGEDCAGVFVESLEYPGEKAIYVYGGENGGAYVPSDSPEKEDVKGRVYSFAFDFIVTGDDLASADEARDRILREIELVDGIEVVGNPNVDATSWSKAEYGISESKKTFKKAIKESEADGRYEYDATSGEDVFIDAESDRIASTIVDNADLCEYMCKFDLGDLDVGYDDGVEWDGNHYYIDGDRVICDGAGWTDDQSVAMFVQYLRDNFNEIA